MGASRKPKDMPRERERERERGFVQSSKEEEKEKEKEVKRLEQGHRVTPVYARACAVPPKKPAAKWNGGINRVFIWQSSGTGNFAFYGKLASVGTELGFVACAAFFETFTALCFEPRDPTKKRPLR